MDMEISNSDESIIRSRRKAARLRILSSSSDEDFVNVINEENECSTEEEDLISKSENDRCREWERRRRNKFNDAIAKLGAIVKAINKTNSPDADMEDMQYPKVEIIQKAIICLTNCAQEKTQLKAEILALQVQLDTEKGKKGASKDASTQVFSGLNKKRKDGKYVKLLMLKKTKSKKGKEKTVIKDPPKNGTVQKLPMLLPRTDFSKKGPENTIVVLPAQPYLFPQRPLLFPSVPPAIVLVDPNLQPLNKTSVPIVNRNNGDITKTTMVNILPISAYSRPLSVTKNKKNSVKLKNDTVKKSAKKLKPSVNVEKESKSKTDPKNKVDINKKDNIINESLDSDNIKCGVKIDSKSVGERNSKEISSDGPINNNTNQSPNNKVDKGEIDKINKHEECEISDATNKPKLRDSIVTTTSTVKLDNVKNTDENSKCNKTLDSKEAITERKEKVKLPNILQSTLCENTVDAGNADVCNVELAEEFLATSPTAAFLMSFPLVSGNRADSPAEETPNSIQTSAIHISKENQRRNELAPPSTSFFEKANNVIKSKQPNKITTCNIPVPKQNEEKYVGNILTKEPYNLPTNASVTKTTTAVTLPNVSHESPFLNLSMPSLISTNCATTDATFSLDFDCSISKTIPSQSNSYVSSNNFFYKSDPFGTVKSSIYSTSNISSSHDFNGLGLYPCAMEKYTSKNKSEYSSVDDNLMKMGSSRLTYDIDLGWSHKGLDFVNCTTTANTFNKDTILATTSTPYTTSYNPFNPEFHIPLVSSANKKDSSNKTSSSFPDTITSFYSQPTNLWTDDVAFYNNNNMSKNLSSKNQNYQSLDHAPTNLKLNSVKHYDNKVAEPNADGGIKSNNNSSVQQISEKYTKKSPSKMHINWMTSEVRPMQNSCNPSTHSEIKDSHKITYNPSEHFTKKQDQSDSNYFPISMHNFPTQTVQDEFQVWPSTRALGTTEISIEPPPINLPTLVGDLALGPHDKKKTGDAAHRVLPQADVQNCGNFLSVTQLMNRSNDNMTSRYHVPNIDQAKSSLKQNHFINDSSRKQMTNLDNHIPQPCYVFNDPKLSNGYMNENLNQFLHTKSKTNSKTEKSSKSQKNNYSTEALLRGASCSQKVQENTKFMMSTQKYTDYSSAQDSSVAQVSHFPPILDYSDNSYASQQYSGTTLYNTTTNTISNSFYSNFMPTSGNLMSSNYASGPFTGEFIDYNQSAECNYANHKYEELKMRSNTVFQPDKVPSNYKSSRRESTSKHKLECSKKESSKKCQSKKPKVNGEIEDWNDHSHLLWQNKASKKHTNLMSDDITFPNYVGNQMSTQYQSDFFNTHLMHTNVQSVGSNVDRSLSSFPVTSRANFNLSTIFPEITMKVQ